MKSYLIKRIYLIGLLFITACAYFDKRSPRQKAEDLTKHYLDSALTGRGIYQIISTSKIDTEVKSQIKDLSVHVMFQGNNAFGIYERHKVVIHFDNKLSRVISLEDGASVKH